MLTGIIGIALLALFLVPVLILNTRKGKKNDQETEEKNNFVNHGTIYSNAIG